MSYIISVLGNAKAIADEEDVKMAEWVKAVWNEPQCEMQVLTKIEECKDVSGNSSIFGVVN